MFGLFRSARPKPPFYPAPRAQLQVERLEERNCPAALSISGLTATRIGSWLTVEGTVTDDSPALASVHLGGAVNTTVTPDASGWFGCAMPYVSGTQVMAQATDAVSMSSATGTVNVNVPANANPFVYFSVCYGSQRQITISGRVFDESPAGRTVTITGMASGTATTDAFGNFFLTLTATGLGTVSASTTDLAGQSSNTPIRTLTSAVPQIMQFTGTQLADGMYELSGRVMDECPSGLTVTLGGEPVSLSNASCTVQPNGTFDYVVQLNGTSSDEGTATAVVTDWWGLTSATVTWTI